MNVYEEDELNRLIRLSEARQYVPGRRYGQCAAEITLERWIRHGVRGKRLRHRKINGVLFTSQRWLNDFMDKVFVITPPLRRKPSGGRHAPK